MPITRPLAAIENDVRAWLQTSRNAFDSQYRDGEGKVWVLKFMAPQYLEGFLRWRRLNVSATPGFTWGDGVYVTPLASPYSTMMYGRVGALGWIARDDSQVVYDAGQPLGVELYQEWIAHSRHDYRFLTTTIHADYFNRLLRNRFRRRFGIEVVIFPPDQYNRFYVSPHTDRWFVLSDWPARPFVPGSSPRFSSRVHECEWCVIVGEEFRCADNRLHYRDLIGPHLTVNPALRIPANRSNLVPLIRNAYQANRTGSWSPQMVSVSP